MVEMAKELSSQFSKRLMMLTMGYRGKMDDENNDIGGKITTTELEGNPKRSSYNKVRLYRIVFNSRFRNSWHMKSEV